MKKSLLVLGLLLVVGSLFGCANPDTGAEKVYEIKMYSPKEAANILTGKNMTLVTEATEGFWKFKDIEKYRRNLYEHTHWAAGINVKTNKPVIFRWTDQTIINTGLTRALYALGLDLKSNHVMCYHFYQTGDTIFIKIKEAPIKEEIEINYIGKDSDNSVVDKLKEGDKLEAIFLNNVDTIYNDTYLDPNSLLPATPSQITQLPQGTINH